MIDWISVNNRLPEKHGTRVLIWTTDADDDYIFTAATWNNGDGFLVTGGYRDHDVTHWATPKAPKGEKDE